MDRAVSARGQGTKMERLKELAYLDEFDFKGMNMHSGRLKEYRDAGSEEIRGELREATGGISETQIFRRTVSRAMRQCKMYTQQKNMILSAEFKEDGTLKLKTAGLKKQQQDQLAEFICFLCIKKIWNDIEQLRDIHYTEEPAVVKNIPERLCSTEDIRHMCALTGLKEPVVEKA